MAHLQTTDKWKLTTYVLNGESYQQAGERFGVSRSTARDIALAYFPKICMPGLAEKESVNVKSRKSMRSFWKESGMI